MAYGYQYQDSGTKCSGKTQPGTGILRQVIDESIPEVGDLGTYVCRPKRTSSRLSLHAEGRAWDAAVSVNDRPFGLKLAQFFVNAAQLLGVQRVIYWEREWDSRAGERYWEPYSGPPHHDHNHVELCWDAALHLTRRQVQAALAKFWFKEPKEDEDVYIQVGNGIWHIVGSHRLKVNHEAAGAKRWEQLKKHGAQAIKVKASDPMVKLFPPLNLED